MFFFFFNDTATTEIYTLSLHDALPISDAVIADIALKGQDGIELIKMIRAQYPDLPILVLSMHDELIYAERSFFAGANGYIMKHEASENIEIGRASCRERV